MIQEKLLKSFFIFNQLKNLDQLGTSKDDDKSYYFYFPPNENGGTYGFKINKSNADISAVMYVSEFWDIDIEFDDLFSNVSEETANAIIFNIDLFRSNIEGGE